MDAKTPTYNHPNHLSNQQHPEEKKFIYELYTLNHSNGSIQDFTTPSPEDQSHQTSSIWDFALFSEETRPKEDPSWWKKFRANLQFRQKWIQLPSSCWSLIQTGIKTAMLLRILTFHSQLGLGLFRCFMSMHTSVNIPFRIWVLIHSPKVTSHSF